MDDPTPTVDAPSKPAQRFRRTRIAVSVFFGVLTVALCVLWVLSWRANRMYVIGNFHMGNYKCEIAHLPAQDTRLSAISIAVYDDLNPMPTQDTGWPRPRQSTFRDLIARLDINIISWPDLNGFAVGLPNRYVMAVSAAIVAFVWFPRSYHFSLRTMLIATTLVAVVLGIAVWLAH